MRKPMILILAGTFTVLLLAALVLWFAPSRHPHGIPASPQAAKPSAEDSTTVVAPPKTAAVTPLLQGVHPVLNGYHRLLGGVVNGQWRGHDEVARLLRGGEIYGFYSRREKVGEAKGPAKGKKEGYLSGEHGYYLDFQKFFPDEAFAICGAWNPLPRVPEIRSESDLATYLPIVAGVLIGQKNKADGMRITEVLTVDLEGDGRAETIVCATNIREEEVDALCSGEVDRPDDRCSLVALSRDGGPAVVLAESYEGMTEYEIPFTADADGDGIMEVMVLAICLDAVPAEGFSIQCERLLKVVGGKIQTLVEINSNPV